MYNNTCKISVVVVTFNRCDELLKTIKAIQNQGIQDSDIIVINNNSTDNTRIFDTNFKNIKAFHLNENIASAGGFSEGMQIAFENGYDWVWLFNDDSRPVNGSLKSMLEYLNSDAKQQVGLLKIANKDENNKAVLLYWNGVRKPVYVDVSNEIVQT